MNVVWLIKYVRQMHLGGETSPTTKVFANYYLIHD